MRHVLLTLVLLGVVGGQVLAQDVTATEEAPAAADVTLNSDAVVNTELVNTELPPVDQAPVVVE